MSISKSSWRDVTEAELAATGKVKLGSVGVVKETQGLEALQMPQDARSKYGAVRTEVDGISFHSAKEAKRYGELKLLEKAGKIFRLQLQPKYRLCAFSREGSQEPVPALGFYIADFRYCNAALCNCAWGCQVEDVKGFKTPLYRWKKKHVEAQYGIQIREL